MNKELKFGLSFIIGIGGIILITLIMYGFLSVIGDFMEKEKQKDLEEVTPECMSRCNRFDMTFYEIVNDGWLYHCWCTDDNKPFKVATLKLDR